MFIVDLNATIRRGFTNLTADYHKLRQEIGVGIDGQYNLQNMTYRNLSDSNKFVT